MPWRQVLDLFDVLDSPSADGAAAAAVLRAAGVEDVAVTQARTDVGHTDFVRATIPGYGGRSSGGRSPTLGVIGRLGGLGARPARIGFVSDGDGALTALAVAAKLGSMCKAGDRLPGDVIVTTHVCPAAPTLPHDPVPFMSSPVDMATMNSREVDEAMEAILSVDTTRGNRVCNHTGFAISPTVRQGWVLRVSEDLLDLQQQVTGQLPVVLPITMQDITPYGNGVYHLNSILQPATATAAPVVGVALTAEVAVAGSGTGATNLASVEQAARFCIEAAKSYGADSLRFCDDEEFGRLVMLYGSMTQLQTPGDRNPR
ncbi:MAG TPA: DUF1177 domain-containing protein [Trebonia sp.]